MPLVNRLTKVLGFVGGALAILWAMRDRLVSIAAPQDPEPPKFRVVPSSGSSVRAADDLTSVPGIGPVFAGRLRDAGITSFADLLSADTARLAEITGASETRAAQWASHASSRV